MLTSESIAMLADEAMQPFEDWLFISEWADAHSLRRQPLIEALKAHRIQQRQVLLLLFACPSLLRSFILILGPYSRHQVS